LDDCAPYLSQIAAIKAFDARDDLEAIRQDYAANRALLLEALPRLGLTRFAPADGAFYIYADISDFASDSISFCQALLDETGVAATPGLDFDPVNGHRYVRFSYAGSFTDCTNLIERLTKWPKIHAQRAYI
jgi:aspartate/methionine/tyrosine aminotransferase